MSARALSSPSRRVLLAALAASSATGCFGSFGATGWLYGWNDSFDNKWIKWLIFLGLTIIPVYGLFIFADYLVINSIEFWTGSNPIKGASNEDGTYVVRKQTGQENLVALELYRDEELERTLYARRSEQGVALLDENGTVMTHGAAALRPGPARA